MSAFPGLRRNAEELAAPLPPLLAAAEHLAMTVLLGEHGRRRSGIGDEFWQYRPVRPGDEARMIDWRRSARSDASASVGQRFACRHLNADRDDVDRRADHCLQRWQSRRADAAVRHFLLPIVPLSALGLVAGPLDPPSG